MTTPLQAFKIHLNITDDDDDAVLEQKLTVATAWVEKITGTTFDVVPAPVAEATRMLAAHLFENREATLAGLTMQEVPFGVMDMLDAYRAWY